MTEKKSRKNEILEKKLALRKQLWPKIKEEELWTHRRKDGFVPIPRVFPLILEMMNDLAGCPVSSTYLDLWCRKFDEQFLTMNRPQREYAFYSGFSGQRSEQTWKDRIRRLAKLGFILVEKGAHGEISYVLILDPIKIILHHAKAGTAGLRKDYLNTLMDRSNEVKAKDINEPVENLPSRMGSRIPAAVKRN